MKYSVSFLLLLALAASNCNGQMEAPARRPPSRPAPSPGGTAGAAPLPRVPPPQNNPNAPVPPQTRPNAQQNPAVPRNPPPRQNAPGAPAAPRPNPQQNPGTRTGPAPPGSGPAPPPRGPTVNNNAPGRAPAPGPGVSGPTGPTGPQAPGPNPPSGPGAGPQTSRPGTTREPPVVGNPVPSDRPDSFPTAPTIAPLPPVHFPNPNNPQSPSFPGGRVGAGRNDARCPRVSDPHRPVQFPHESNCAAFYRCENGLAFEHRCPDGLHWNAERNVCDFPGNAGCQSGAPLPRPQPNPMFPPSNNWNQPRNNPNPGYEHPIVIPMAPRT